MDIVDQHTNVPPLVYLDGADVSVILGSIDPISTVREAFAGFSTGRSGIESEASLYWTSPTETQARSLVLPAWHAGSYGCKIINANLGNTSKGLPRAHGLIVMHDAASAAPVCVMEAGHISALRTAAVSVAALIETVQLEEIKSIAFLGCGRQARCHLQLLLDQGSRPESVWAFDWDPTAVTDLAEAFSDRCLVRPSADPESAVREAQVTIAATTTTEPYVELDWLQPGSVFVNVSLDDATADLLIGCDRLIVDSWQLVREDKRRLLGRLAHEGLVRGPEHPRVAGVRTVDAELPDLFARGYSERPLEAHETVVVNPFGMGLNDIAFAAKVMRVAQATGRGRILPR